MLKTTSKKINKNRLKPIIIGVFLIASFFISQTVSAATLFISPSSNSYFKSKQFEVSVYVNSTNQSLNAVSGTLVYPSDKLEVVSVSKAGSIFNFWVQEPSFNNAGGKIMFEGIVLNPGFNGSAGKLINVTFRTKNSGSAKLSFSAASVLANDGKGTNILTGTGSATFSIKELVPEETEENHIDIKTEKPSGTVTPANGLAAPVINSSSHPDRSAWYASSTAEFHWSVPAGVNSVSLLVSASAQANPTVNYTPAISSKIIKDLDDGIWYLHASFRYNNGLSAVSSFPVKIDTTPPDNLNIAPIAQEEGAGASALLKFLLSGSDKQSGIDYYEVSFDQQTPFRVNGDQGGIIEAPKLSGGEHQIKMRAYDFAGNYADANLKFSVAQPNLPVINYFPQVLSAKSAFVLTGQVLPQSLAQINLQKMNGHEYVYIVPTDEYGRFSFTLERLPAGDYSFRVKILGETGPGAVTENYNFTVTGETNYLPWILAAMLISLAFNLFFLVNHFKDKYRFVKKSRRFVRAVKRSSKILR